MQRKLFDPADSWDDETYGVDASEKIDDENSENGFPNHVAQNFKRSADHPRAYGGCNLGPVMPNVEWTPDTAENFDGEDSEVNPLLSDESEKNVVYEDDFKEYEVDTSVRGVVFEDNWQNDLYRRICLRYGRLEGSQVVGKTNDMLILALKKILKIAQTLESVDVDPLLPGTFQSWESTVEVGELFKFNMSWLRNLVNEVKALFSSRRSLAEDVGIRNACQSLSRLREKAELAKKQLEALIQAEKDATKAVGEAYTRLKSATIFQLKI